MSPSGSGPILHRSLFGAITEPSEAVFNLSIKTPHLQLLSDIAIVI